MTPNAEEFSKTIYIYHKKFFRMSLSRGAVLQYQTPTNNQLDLLMPQIQHLNLLTPITYRVTTSINDTEFSAQGAKTAF